MFLLSLRLCRPKAYQLTKFSNGLDAASAFDALIACLATCSNNKTVYDVGGMLDEPWHGGVRQRHLASNP